MREKKGERERVSETSDVSTRRFILSLPMRKMAVRVGADILRIRRDPMVLK